MNNFFTKYHTLKNRNTAITLILVIAFAFRVWGINNSLPYIYDPDEPVNFSNILLISSGNPPNSFFYNYPALVFYIQIIYYHIYSLVTPMLNCCGWQDPISMNVISPGNGFISNPSSFLAERYLTLVFSLFTIFLVFITAKKLSKNNFSAAIAAALICISPVAVGQAKVIALDTYVAFFVMAAIYAAISESYIVASFLAGLAGAAKYNGAAVIFIPQALYFIKFRLSGLLKQTFYLSIFVFILGLSVGFSYGILNSQNFTQGIGFDLTHYATNHAGAEGNSLIFYLSTLLKRETALFVFSLIGLYFAVRKKIVNLVVIGLFGVGYVAVMGFFQVHFSRHLLLALGPMAIVASYGIGKFYTLFKPQLKLIPIAAVILLMTISLSQSVIDSNAQTRDPRKSARQWIDRNIPAGSKIFLEGYGPWINPDKYKITENSLIFVPSKEIVNGKEEYLVAAEGTYGRYFDNPSKYPNEVRKYNNIFNNFKQVAYFNDYGYEIRIFSNARK